IAVEETNELLKIQMADYLEFIQRLSDEVNIMDRSFYLVTSHAKTPTQSTLTQRTILDRFLGGKKTKETVYSVKEFQDLLGQLQEKTQIVCGRLEAMGVKTEILNTEGLIELFYNTYNPEESGAQKLAESRSLTGGIVQTDVGQELGKIPAPVQAALNEARSGSVLVGPTPLDPAQASSGDQPANQPDPLKKELAEPTIEQPIISRKRSLREILTHLGQRQPQTASELELESIKKGLTDVLDIISPAGLAVTANYLQLGNFYARTLFVFTYPRYLSTGWLSPILNIDTTIDVSMFIYPVETSVILSSFRRKTTQLQSSLQIEQEKGLIRNPELETAIGDIEELRDTLQKGETRLFQSSLYFTLYAKSLEDLQKLTKQVESTLGGMLIYTKVALLQMEPGFNSTLPIASNDLDIVRNLDTESLATSFPFSSQDLSHHDGVLYGINLHNSSLVLFDRFRMENANQVVFAKSGAGKSYAVKLEALRLLMMGTELIIIDPENEYQALAQTVGGSFIELSLNSSQKINPFDLPRFTTDDQDTGEDLLRGTIAGLNGLISLMAGGLSAEENAILDKALYETYALKDITVDPKTQAGTPPLMIDLVGVLANIGGAENLVNRLLKFTEGSYSNLFDAPTNIDMNNRVTVFSIRNMEDELRPLAMYLVLNYIWSRVKSELKRRLLVIDEAWWMMRYEDTAKFLNAMTKRARKYYLGVSVISQDVEDFIDNNYGKAIVSNSATQLLLGQAPSAVDKLAGVFKLTDGEKQFLLGADVGQGLLVAGLDRAAVQIIASYTEDQFITTNPEQLLAMFGRGD
ncbi:MAG: DUF87 domain-containing protein, partial [Patescibacteria group bacterium]